MATESEFDKFKREASKNRPICKEVLLSELNIISDDKIEYRGVKLDLLSGAISDLRTLLHLPKQFANELSKAMGEDMRKKLADFCKNMRLLNGKNATATLLINATSHKVERILRFNNLLSTETYFEIFDKLMNNHNFEIQELRSSDDGSLAISLTSRDDEFQVGKFSEEIFHPGLTLKNTLDDGAFVSSYLFRLICGNGMTGTDFGGPEGGPKGGGGGPITLGGPGFTHMNEFYQRINELVKGGFYPQAFKDKVIVAKNCLASFAEVNQAARLILDNSDMKVEFVDKYIPLVDIRNKFAGKGWDWLKANMKQQQNAVTNVPIWDIINGVTDFASHNYGYKVSDSNRLYMQAGAGSMLTKETYDTQNIVHVRLDR